MSLALPAANLATTGPGSLPLSVKLILTSLSFAKIFHPASPISSVPLAQKLISFAACAARGKIPAVSAPAPRAARWTSWRRVSCDRIDDEGLLQPRCVITISRSHRASEFPSRLDHCRFRHQKRLHRLPNDLDAAARLGCDEFPIRGQKKFERLTIDEPRRDLDVSTLIGGGSDRHWPEIAPFIRPRDPYPLRSQRQYVSLTRFPANRRLTIDVSSRHECAPAGGARVNTLWLQYCIEPDGSSNEGIGRSFEQLARRAHLLDPASPQKGNTVAERKRLVMVVRHGEKGRAKLAMQMTDLIAH